MQGDTIWNDQIYEYLKTSKKFLIVDGTDELKYTTILESSNFWEKNKNFLYETKYRLAGIKKFVGDMLKVIKSKNKTKKINMEDLLANSLTLRSIRKENKTLFEQEIDSIRAYFSNVLRHNLFKVTGSKMDDIIYMTEPQEEPEIPDVKKKKTTIIKKKPKELLQKVIERLGPDEVIDVSKLRADGKGYSKTKTWGGPRSKKYFTQNLPIISNNYPSYQMAVSMIRGGNSYYAEDLEYIRKLFDADVTIGNISKLKLKEPIKKLPLRAEQVGKVVKYNFDKEKGKTPDRLHYDIEPIDTAPVFTKQRLRELWREKKKRELEEKKLEEELKKLQELEDEALEDVSEDQSAENILRQLEDFSEDNSEKIIQNLEDFETSQDVSEIEESEKIESPKGRRKSKELEESEESEGSDFYKGHTDDTSEKTQKSFEKGLDIDVFDFKKYKKEYDLLKEYFDDVELYLRTAKLIDVKYSEITNVSDRRKFTISFNKNKNEMSEEDFIEYLETITTPIFMDLFVRYWLKHFYGKDAYKKYKQYWVSGGEMSFEDKEPAQFFNWAYQKNVDPEITHYEDDPEATNLERVIFVTI